MLLTEKKHDIKAEVGDGESQARWSWMNVGTFSSSPVESQHVEGAKPETKQDMTWTWLVYPVILLNCHHGNHGTKIRLHPNKLFSEGVWDFFLYRVFAPWSIRSILPDTVLTFRSPHAFSSGALIVKCLLGSRMSRTSSCHLSRLVYTTSIAESNKGGFEECRFSLPNTENSRFPHELAWNMSWHEDLQKASTRVWFPWIQK